MKARDDRRMMDLEQIRNALFTITIMATIREQAPLSAGTASVTVIVLISAMTHGISSH